MIDVLHVVVTVSAFALLFFVARSMGRTTGFREGRESLLAEWRRPPKVARFDRSGLRGDDAVPDRVVEEAIRVLDALPAGLPGPVKVEVRQSSGARSACLRADYPDGSSIAVEGWNEGEDRELWRLRVGDAEVEWAGPDCPARRAWLRAWATYSDLVEAEMLCAFPKRVNS